MNIKSISKLILLSSIALISACSNSNNSETSEIPCIAPEITMWSGFSSDYNELLNDVIGKLNSNNSGNCKFHVSHTPNKNYGSVIQAIDGRTFPNIVTGTPNEFDEYRNRGVLVPLNDLITKYNDEHDTNLINDIYPQYRKENATMLYDSSHKDGYVFGLPFAKSTEIMFCNGYLLDYVKDINPTIDINCNDTLTWQKLASEGPKIVAAMQTAKYGKAVTDTDAKFLVGKVNDQNVASDFRISDATSIDAVVLADGEKVLQDISNITQSSFCVLKYDRAWSLFITILNQWGSKYSEINSTIYSENNGYGRVYFWDNENKTKTLNALEYLKDLHDGGIVKLPEGSAGGSYNEFEDGKCLFSVSFSTLLSNFIDDDKRIEINAIPFFDDGDIVRKTVVSAGKSMCLLNQFSSAETKELELKRSFEAMVDLCTGKSQAYFDTKAGFFPISKTAFNDETYQSFLNGSHSKYLDKMYQKAARLNANTYNSFGWDVYVEPAFKDSDTLTGTINQIIPHIFSNPKSNISSYMNSVWSSINSNFK